MAKLITVTAAIVFSLVLWKAIPNRNQCANSVSCVGDLSGAYEPGRENTFLGRKVASPVFQPDEASPRPFLGATTENKHIYVDLATQSLSAYEGTKLVYHFPVSTGKWYPTPTGEFKIWVKLRNAHMEGGSQALGTYYNLYNVPYTMFFYGDSLTKDRGFSIHGAYWHNNFGYPMSHGCINMRPADAKKIYDWAEPQTSGLITYASAGDGGTLVSVYGEPPVE